MSFAEGDLVVVAARTGVGENKPGGVGRVTRCGEGCVDVKYVLGGRERGVGLAFVSAYADEERAKRTVHGRCRRCGCLVVDCLHAQPDDNGDRDDVERQQALARRRKIARSWRKAITGAAREDLLSSEGSSSEDALDEDGDASSDALDEDGEAPFIEDVGANEDTGGEAPFIAAEDDGESMPRDLEPLAPPKRASANALRRRMLRIQRFVETRGVQHARDEVAKLRVRATTVQDGGALDALERAASNVGAFVLRGLRRRGVDVADACYRRLVAKGAPGLEAAARKQDLLDDALRDIETDLDSLLELARDRCCSQEDAAPTRAARKERDAVAADAALLDVWGWNIDEVEPDDVDDDDVWGWQSARENERPHRRQSAEDLDEDVWGWQAARVEETTAMEERRTRQQVPGRVEERRRRQRPAESSSDYDYGSRDDGRRNNKRPLEDVAEETSSQRRRVRVVEAATIRAVSVVPLAATAFARPSSSYRNAALEVDDDLAAGVLRRAIDDAASGIEGTRFEEFARAARRAALGLLEETVSVRRWGADLMPAALAALDDADRAAAHAADDRAEIDDLRLALLGRAAMETRCRDVGEALVCSLVAASTRDAARRSACALAVKGGDGERARRAATAAWAWRASAAALSSDGESAAPLWPVIGRHLGGDARFSLEVTTFAAVALAAEPPFSGLEGAWDLVRDRIEVVASLRAATLLCVAKARGDDAKLWRLWDRAVAAAKSPSSREDDRQWSAFFARRRRRHIKRSPTGLALVGASFATAPPGVPGLARAVAEVVLAFATSRPAGVRRRRVTLELVRRRALPAVAKNPAARALVVSALLSLADAGLLDVDVGLVRAVASCCAGDASTDAKLAASALACLAGDQHARAAVAKWLASFAATDDGAAVLLVDLLRDLDASSEPSEDDALDAMAAGVRAAAERFSSSTPPSLASRLATAGLRATVVALDAATPPPPREASPTTPRPEGTDPFFVDDVDWDAVGAATLVAEAEHERTLVARAHDPVLRAAGALLSAIPADLPRRCADDDDATALVAGALADAAVARSAAKPESTQQLPGLAVLGALVRHSQNARNVVARCQAAHPWAPSICARS